MDRQILLINTARALKFLEDYTDRQVQLWKILQTYHNVPVQIADIHTHFDHSKSTIHTDFNYLKEATAKNNHNLYTNLTLQQAYTSTLRSHIKNIYTKISELQHQIQQHCMYPHNTEHANNDTVQLLAPDFDSDIDSNNQPVPASDALTQTKQHQQNTLHPIDANKSEPDTMQTRDNLNETD